MPVRSASSPLTTERFAPLPPGAVVGILGGGQLGRMLASAAARLGMRTHVYAPDPDPPAAQLSNRTTTADFEDDEALRRFADVVDVVTYEFENVPVEAVDRIGKYRPVRPGRQALAIAQDRFEEKSFLRKSGLCVARFANVESPQDLAEAVASIGYPSILKSRRFGYDGKGQASIDGPEDLETAVRITKSGSAILEQKIQFSREVSVIGARGAHGFPVCYDPGENRHQNGILRETRVPARLAAGERARAIHMAGTIMDRLDYVGVIGVEIFVTPDGLLVNEFAPRVHNSGHWTLNGCVVDQFEQHIRAICGWPLGDARRHSDVVMSNLIGSDMRVAHDLAACSSTAIHLYGKRDVRPGRKMGHVNRVTGPAGLD